MKKALLVFLIVLLSGSINAGAIYFFDPVEYGEVSYGGGSAVGFPSEKSEVNLFSTEKTFEEVVLEGWAAFAEEIDVSEFEIKVEDFTDLYYDVINNNPSYDYVRKDYIYNYYTEEDGNNYIESIVPTYFLSEKTFEETILEGWSSFSQEIVVRGYDIKEEDLERLYDEIFFNHPLYYYIGRNYRYTWFTYPKDDTKYIHSILPTYTTTDINEIAAMHKAIEEETDNILLYIENDMTDFEKVMTVHDYMVIHYDYDYTYENHTISIMVTKTGVCESYTFAFMHIMDILGIESRYVSSRLMNHAWNLVKINGNWYHIDLTWDDGGNADQTGHQFELLSDKKIQELEKPHYDYDTGGIVADSEIYDEAEWHDNHSQIVSLKGKIYWVNENVLVNDAGEVVNSALDGGDGMWSIGDGYYFEESNYTGLAVFNGKLYYNTDKAIYAYNPETKQSVKVKDIDGVCGIHIDGNILKHGMFDREKVIIVEGVEHKGDFYEADDIIKLSGARITVPYIKNGKAVAKIYTDGTEKVNILSFGKNGVEKERAEEGITSVEIDAESFDYIYFLDDKLNPLHDKVKISK